MTNPKPTIIVAGDVCIDWLSIPVEQVPVPADNGKNSPTTGRFAAAAICTRAAAAHG